MTHDLRLALGLASNGVSPRERHPKVGWAFGDDWRWLKKSLSLRAARGESVIIADELLDVVADKEGTDVGVAGELRRALAPFRRVTAVVTYRPRTHHLRSACNSGWQTVYRVMVSHQGFSRELFVISRVSRCPN